MLSMEPTSSPRGGRGERGPAGSDDEGPAGLSTLDRVVEEAIGAKIRGARAEKGWNQDQLAKATGLDKKTIGRVENAQTKITTRILYRIAFALDIEPEVLTRSANDALRQALAERASVQE